MNDAMVIVFPTWVFWLLVTIGVLNSIDLTLKIVNHFLAKRVKKACPPAKCSKCKASDPAITDLCKDTACGMREP